MKGKAFMFAVAFLVLAGCTIGASQTIRLKGNVNPGQISLDKRMPVSIEATVENIGNSTETVTVDVEETEGLDVEKPERREFTLKPGESRVVVFQGTLEERAVSGKYRIEITAATKGGGTVSEVAFLNVVSKSGFI